MALRFVEIFLVKERQEELGSILADFASAEVVQREFEQGQLHTKLLMKAEQTEELLDRLEARFSLKEGFRVVIVPVAATIPRMEEPEPEAKAAVEAKPDSKRGFFQVARISREELYAQIHEASQLTGLFLLLVVISSIVAAIGLLRDNTAVVIGAMVIAPLLGPNVALSLAATLGDMNLARDGRKANLAGIAIPLLLAGLVGWLFAAEPLCAELTSRTEVNLSDVILALASGCMAALSFTTALSSALIGVMVAVALLPPLVACGLLAGAGQWQMAAGAGLLFLTNLICVNLAGVATFLLQGIRPLWWWEKGKARTAARRALILWIILLGVLVILILTSQKWLI